MISAVNLYVSGCTPVTSMAIHILEGDAGVSDSLAILLKNMGHDVVEHRDGLSFFAHEPPGRHDSVIVDLALPATGGIAVIKWLQGLREPPHIVAISAQSQPAIDAELRGMQVPHLVRKPLRADAILKYLERFALAG
jgi:FixJ family two-component response regulator